MELPLAMFNICVAMNEWMALNHLKEELSLLVASDFRKFWNLSISINTLTFLPTSTVILSTLWFVLRDATFSLFRPPIWFRNTFLFVANLQIPSNHSRTTPQTIKYQKLQSINMEAFKADIKILIWIDIRKQMQLNWLTNMTVSSTLSSIFLPHWFPKRYP